MSVGQRRQLTLDEAIEFHRLWSEEDRDVARQVMVWAQHRDPQLTAYSPPAGVVAVLAAGSGQRLVTFRQRYIRFHGGQPPPFDGVEPGSAPRTWSLQLSRRNHK